MLQVACFSVSMAIQQYARPRTSLIIRRNTTCTLVEFKAVVPSIYRKARSCRRRHLEEIEARIILTTRSGNRRLSPHSQRSAQ